MALRMKRDLNMILINRLQKDVYRRQKMYDRQRRKNVKEDRSRCVLQKFSPSILSCTYRALIVKRRNNYLELLTFDARRYLILQMRARPESGTYLSPLAFQGYEIHAGKSRGCRGIPVHAAWRLQPQPPQALAATAAESRVPSEYGSPTAARSLAALLMLCQS